MLTPAKCRHPYPCFVQAWTQLYFSVRAASCVADEFGEAAVDWLGIVYRLLDIIDQLMTESNSESSKSMVLN